MSASVATSKLPWLELAVEAAVGNGLGAGVYRRWVSGLGLLGTECMIEVGTGGGARAAAGWPAAPARAGGFRHV